MKEYSIESKDVQIIVHAHNNKDAWRQFFAKVRENGWAGRVGIIANMKAPGWKSKDDTLVFRTYPVLWLMKQVPWDTLVDSLAIHLEVQREDAAKILSDSIEKDKWAVPAEAIDLEHDWKGRRLNSD